MSSKGRVAAVLAAAALALAACSSTTPEASTGASAAAAACRASTEAGQVAVEMKDFKFSTEPVQAKVGQVVTWTNQDTAPHTATVTGAAACTTGNLSKGQSGGIAFTAAGTYLYFCAIHPSQMKGTIVVTE